MVSTKITIDLLCSDPDGDDPHEGREWPLTLSPRIVRDNFAIDYNTVIFTFPRYTILNRV